MEHLYPCGARVTALEKWDDYTEARDPMLFGTDIADAPWTILTSSDKKYARIARMQHFLHSREYPHKGRPAVAQADPLIAGQSPHMIGRSRHILGPSLRKW